MSRNSTSEKLPKKMHFKHGRYYYVHQNKWHSLSTDYAESLVKYAALIRPDSGNMATLLEKFLLDIEPTVAKNTFRTYRSATEKLKKVFTEFQPAQVKPLHIHRVLDKYRATPAMANVMRNVLKQAFTKWIMWGECENNPVLVVPPFKAHKRDRFITDSEYALLREKASPTMRAIMAICYLTGQRIGDVLKIKLSDISETGIFFKQQKTGNRLVVGMSVDLMNAIEEAKRLHTSVKGLTLFHTRQGNPLAYWTVRTLWNRAVKAAGLEDVHLHDIRAKAATDAKMQGLDSKKLLGHTTESSHQRYLRSKEIPVAAPVKLRQSNK